MDRTVIVNSATKLGPDAHDAVVVCGSHGGLYPAWLAARAGVRAVVLNDAGIGRHQAGIAGVHWLDAFDIPACAVDYRSARIGDGADSLAHGIVTMSNGAAARHGCVPGHTCRQVVKCLLENADEAEPSEIPVDMGEHRVRVPNTGHREVWLMDSVAMARPEDGRKIVVTGSHGALLGGEAGDGVLAMDVFAAFFNDAGGGKQEAGYARLPVLDARGIAAATVSAFTARIGDGRSTYETGVISRVNDTARRLELKEGMTAREAVARLVGLG
jgi:hypothetical protein